ncbi:hypothetical protein [Polaribacter sp.]|jgi:hypothetical protein|uniref:hypothetical protein n=1 Tax=Polaribacter sp. TaxID=1920175 RepID=UPI0007132493|nr:MAG: hypothetical protein ABS28_07845 [Cryomorphaceae bacterium BACL22 MAG-120619-bin32]
MTQNSNKPTTSFWVIGVLALLWNALGVMAYLGQKLMTDEMKAMIPAEQLEIIENTPAWATAAFATAVWFGFIACIVLLMRKKLAKVLFMISLIGVLVQLVYNFFMTNAIEVYGTDSLIQALVTVSVGLFMIWHAKKYTEDGILS